ncbi:L-2-hydroxyglutarate oxidase [Metabacillus iocasae]|uniref:L-2-hydroxyglutarate oxidase n=1 Tax=Priestia iocasae TaxID=2291674 RepID=A0ABS2QU62_9BACI|nr:L-2-hydroxyglutarate oxidase [Metabacillus iocasae]MBM7703005.1 L-2-hydroxyglutarate oxidase [Metabacillus iocasae]
MYDYAIIGGGIVGLSVGLSLVEQLPGVKVAIIEKEAKLASHQTGHNSGVIHSGIYYKPGSFKAKFAKEGSQSMIAFCQKHEIDHDICGKVIVAATEAERVELHKLYERGLQNGLDLQLLSKEELHEIEPYVNGIEAIRVPTAGIVNYRQVCEKMGKLITEQGGDIFLQSPVEHIKEHEEGVTIQTSNTTIQAQMLINCAGLHSDRIAKKAGYELDMKIVPFRGEYYQLKEEKRHLVNHLIYPVPNPSFPFLGVHFTRMIDGAIDVGPNAVLSFKREGYKKTDFHAGDLAEVLTYKGFWKLASRYMKEGMGEMARSYNKRLFLKEVQRLMPMIEEADLIPAPAGVRAQALRDDGGLVDDFFIVKGTKSIHICNAPSPAATASLEIGKHVVDLIEKQTSIQV